MLGLSLIITVLTQIASTIFNLRGWRLKSGLVALLTELEVDPAAAKTGIRNLLTHPLITNSLWFKSRPAIAIDKEDLKALFTKKVVGEAVANKAADVEKWFDSTMSKVAHQFTACTRLFTIVAAYIIAITIHLDSFDLVKRLYADSDLRASMAGAAGAMLTQAQDVLATPTTYNDAAIKLVNAAKPVKGNTDGLEAPGQALRTHEQAESWIRSRTADPVEAQKRLDAYDALLQEDLSGRLPQLFDRATQIKKSLDAEGFRLIPTPFKGPSAFPLCTRRGLLSWLGVLISGALLSLGAPFWFNALKTVSNLRPTVAGKVDSRAAERTS